MFTNQEPVIYAHRGDWHLQVFKQNSVEAIMSAIRSGFGIETDFRMDQVGLALGHDVVEVGPRDAISILAESNCPLALNIKQDGMAQKINEVFELSNRRDSFIFDSSIPQAIEYRKHKTPQALRLSEYEKSLAWNSEYIWLDSFHSEWWMREVGALDYFLTNKVIVVSPELHGRPHLEAWEWLKSSSRNHQFNYGICTDFPHELRRMYNE